MEPQRHQSISTSHRAFLIIIFLLSAAGFAAAPADCRAICKKGKSALQSGSLDSAKYYFFLAYKKGMPPESLYYFLGETYLANHTYDSALALNYAIGKTEDKPFLTRVLKQRYLIYSGLGWDGMAESVLDSMKSMNSYRASALVPELSFNIGTGYKY
jgi:hypothetical protein